MVISSIVRWSGRGGRGRNRKHHHPNDCRPQNCGLDKVLFREFHEERPLWSSIGSRMRLTHGTGLSQHLRKPQNLQRTPRISPHDFTSAVTRLCHLEIRLIGRNRTLSVSYTKRRGEVDIYPRACCAFSTHIRGVLSARRPRNPPCGTPGVARSVGDGNQVGLTGPVHR